MKPTVFDRRPRVETYDDQGQQEPAQGGACGSSMSHGVIVTTEGGPGYIDHNRTDQYVDLGLCANVVIKATLALFAAAHCDVTCLYYES